MEKKYEVNQKSNIFFSLIFFQSLNKGFLIYIVGSLFSDRTYYNEFVESGSKSWALMRRRLVLGVKNTQNRAAQRPREKGPLARGREPPTLLAPQEPLPFFWASFFLFLHFLCEISVVIYHSPLFIFHLHLSIIHAYSRVHVPLATLSGAL